MKATLIALCVASTLIAAGCNRSSSTPTVTPEPDPVPTPEPDPDPDPQPVLQLGDPLPGLTAQELAAFERGRVQFLKRWKPSEGLGPRYNATSCMSCHSSPVIGGGTDLYRNFYVATFGTGPYFNLPGMPSPVVPAFGPATGNTFTLEGDRVTIPDTLGPFPVQVEQRNSIPIFGTGLFERISDVTILANADPDDLDGDGISGRANNDGAGLGRFGTKAQANNIELFTRAPLFNQMGISSNPFEGAGASVSLGHGALMQGSSTPNASTADIDGVPDPEIEPSDLGDLIAFSRFLAPPQPRPFDEAATRGEQVFEDAGCAKCHIPALEGSTGPVRAYTDLLLHDMGPDLAGEVSFGTPQIGANDTSFTGAEWRTAPLWGISKMGPYLHDGRAPTLDDAIRAHGGEGAAARDTYLGLTDAQRSDLLDFLRHL